MAQPELLPLLPVKLAKCSVPLVWIDTSIFIRGARNRIGSSCRDPLAIQNGWILKRTADLVHQGRLLCPDAYQRHEVFKDTDDFLSVISPLSLGIRTLPAAQVREHQEFRALKAFALGESFLELSVRDLFAGSPTRELAQRRDENLIIDLCERRDSVWIERALERKKRIRSDWDRLRKQRLKSGVTFREQVRVEVSDEIRVKIEALVATLGGAADSVDLGNCVLELQRLHWYWQRLVGGNCSRNMFDFFESPYYFSVPSVRISSLLTAKLLTGTQPIKSGDAADIEHISTILPYADLMIIDKAMKSYVIQLGLDRMYDCKVCYLGDHREIDAFFDKCELVPSVSLESA